MRTTELFWKLFANTGSINAYLLYRKTKPVAERILERFTPSDGDIA